MSSESSTINKLRTSVLNNYKHPQIIHNSRTTHPTEKVFYVCSYGGSGSKVLCKYLSQFGTVKHVHSRNPPANLTHIGLNANYGEWFGPTPVDPQDLRKYYVIFIYRDPIKAIHSRFQTPAHLAHIQINPNTTLQQVIDTKKDLYGIENFFDNYTSKRQRNYKIYCVKYEDFFANIDTFNKMFDIKCGRDQYPVEKTTKKIISQETINALEDIYANVFKKMRAMGFITVV
jgi:hypothetical protein